ncbi:MAG: DUF4214 domain-containing protein [Thermoanaerobaculia bacterium]
MGKRFSGIAHECAVFALYLALTTLMTWPLARQIAGATADQVDPYINTWIVSWVGRTLVSNPAALFDAPMFYPAHDTLAFSENLIGIAILAVPMQLTGVPPLAVHNILLLLGFAASGYGAFVLARKVTRSEPAAFVAGVFFAFPLFRFNHLSHLQHVWSASIPLLLAAVFHLLERTTWRSVALLVAALVWNAYANMHWLVFGTFAAVLTFGAGAYFSGRLRDRDLLTKATAAALIAGALVYPLKFPYDAVRENYGLVRSLDEVRDYSATIEGWVTAPLRSVVYGRAMNDGTLNPETWLFPGFLAILLGVYALVTVRTAEGERRSVPRRVHAWLLRTLDAAAAAGVVTWLLALGTARPMRFLPDPSTAGLLLAAIVALRLSLRMPYRVGAPPRTLRDAVLASRIPLSIWCAILWIVIGVWGSLGPDGWLHRLLASAIDAVAGIRAPARWAIVAYVGLAVLVAHAVTGIADRLRKRSGKSVALAVSGVFALLFLHELRAAPVRWYLQPSHAPRVYEWLAKAPLEGAVLEMPLVRQWSDYRYLLHAAVHERALVNGVSGHVPPGYRKLVAMSEADPIPPAFLQRILRSGCEVIVIHVDQLGPHEDVVRRWLVAGLTGGELHAIGWFPHDLRGDYVVALRPPSSALAASAGDAQPSFSASDLAMKFPLAPERPYAFYQHPTTWRGAVRIEGWAAAEAGVKEVNLLFENGSVRVPALLGPRDDLVKAYPDFRGSQMAGFSASFPGRPKHVRRDTDVRIEVVDARGEATRFESTFITWRPRGDIRGVEWDPQSLTRLVRALSLEPARDARRLVRSEITALELAEASHLSDGRLTDRAFVDGSFRAIVARVPDAGTRSMYLDQLRSGRSRRRALQTLLRSREFELKHLTAEAEAEAGLK